MDTSLDTAREHELPALASYESASYPGHTAGHLDTGNAGPKLPRHMAVMPIVRPRIEEDSVTLSREEVLSLIEGEAKMLGLTRDDAIARVKGGPTAHGYIWDDISLLVSLLSD